MVALNMRFKVLNMRFKVYLRMLSKFVILQTENVLVNLVISMIGDEKLNIFVRFQQIKKI